MKEIPQEAKELQRKTITQNCSQCNECFITVDNGCGNEYQGLNEECEWAEQRQQAYLYYKKAANHAGAALRACLNEGKYIAEGGQIVRF
jgi:hypothetical protein